MVRPILASVTPAGAGGAITGRWPSSDSKRPWLPISRVFRPRESSKSTWLYMPSPGPTVVQGSRVTRPLGPFDGPFQVVILQTGVDVYGSSHVDANA